MSHIDIKPNYKYRAKLYVSIAWRAKRPLRKTLFSQRLYEDLNEHRGTNRGADVSAAPLDEKCLQKVLVIVAIYIYIYIIMMLNFCSHIYFLYIETRRERERESEREREVHFPYRYKTKL